MFEKVCYYKWEYNKARDKDFKALGYDETYEICLTCKHQKECDWKNFEDLESKL